MNGRIIHTQEDIDEGAAWLAAHEPVFAGILAATGPLPLRRRDGGFTPLLSAIVSQQLSVSAADAIWARMEAAGLTSAQRLSEADEAGLRACGLSRQKIRCARALAAAGIDFAALETASDEAAIAALTAVSGIGRWTAEIYLMFSLGRADLLAAGDLALQEAARMAFALDARPGERALRAMAENWSPWRAVAARALWAYYRLARQREGIR